MPGTSTRSSNTRFLASSILIAAIAFPVLWHAGSIAANAQTNRIQPANAQPTSSSRPARIATVDTFAVLQLQLNTDQFVSQRVALEEQFREAVAPLEQQDSDLQSQLAELAPTDPRVPQLQAQRQQLFGQFNQLRQQLALASDRLSAEQAAIAYRQVHEQVNTIAERRGFTHVFGTRMQVDLMAPQDSNSAMQEILGRPVLRAPEGSDITDAVLASMNLERPEPDVTNAPAIPEMPSVRPGG